MFARLTFLLICWLVSVSTIPIIKSYNVQFYVTNAYFLLATIFPSTTQNNCICQCYANSSCITGTFFGFNKTCVLFSAYLQQGQLSSMNTNSSTSVFSFPNRTSSFGKSMKCFLKIRMI